MSKGKEPPFYTAEEIFSSNIYPESSDSSADQQQRDREPKAVRERLEFMAVQERMKAKQWVKDECIAQHLELLKCFKANKLLPLCGPESSTFWGCITEAKKVMSLKEEGWKILQEEKYISKYE